MMKQAFRREYRSAQQKYPDWTHENLPIQSVISKFLLLHKDHLAVSKPFMKNIQKNENVVFSNLGLK